jgi:hypothetical protein
MPRRRAHPSEWVVRCVVEVRTVLVALLLWACAPCTQGFDQNVRVNRDASVVGEFQRRISGYVRLHKEVAAQLPPLKPLDSSAQINTYESELADRIRAARPTAKQGDIFSSTIAAEFRRLIGLSMQGAEGVRIRASLQRGAPTNIPIAVNRSYPLTASRETTPPSLLLNLPRLPSELEYRVVGNELVLLDATADVIVDFIPNAIPQPLPTAR